MSKIRKIMAIKKKCKENGIRVDVLGSNPHSNGEFFSKSKFDFFEIIDLIVIRMRDTHKNTKEVISKKKIIYIKC